MFSSRPRSRKSPRSSSRRTAFKPLPAERFEPRIVPATFAVVNTLDSGTGSLRQAILDANANAGSDLIRFAIPSTDGGFVDVDSSLPGGDPAPDAYVIRPLSRLPGLNDSTGGTTIDGRSQTAFGGDTNPFGPEVVLNGSLAGLQTDALVLAADSNQVLGLNIQGFRGDGLGGFGIGVLVHPLASHNKVAGNYIGTDATGTVAAANFHGVYVRGSDNLVGGTTVADRNVISGQAGDPIYTEGGVAIDGTNNRVQGNYIGTNAAGTAAISNDGGVGISGPGNMVGGTAPGAGNLISGNGGINLILFGGGDGTVVQGNLIGTDATGTVAIPVNYGVYVQTSGNTIGGTAAGAETSSPAATPASTWSPAQTTPFRATTSVPTSPGRGPSETRTASWLGAREHDRRDLAGGGQPHFRQLRRRRPAGRHS